MVYHEYRKTWVPFVGEKLEQTVRKIGEFKKSKFVKSKLDFKRLLRQTKGTRKSSKSRGIRITWYSKN